MKNFPLQTNNVSNQVYADGQQGTIAPNPRRRQLILFLPDNSNYTLALGNVANTFLTAGERVVLDGQQGGLSFTIGGGGRLIVTELSLANEFSG